MRINTKKVTSLALATLIAIGSTSAYAADFKDVTKNHWAKAHIQRGSDLGLLVGYDDGTFKPDKSIARIEAISLSARAMNLKQEEIDKAIAKHGKTITDSGFDAWAIKDLSIALSEGIINTGNLKQLYNDNGSFSLSPREEAVIFMAKAMGLEEEAKALGNDVKLPFKDSGKIQKPARPYIYLLHEHGIIRGDENGYFNPSDAINRASMSIVVSLAYDYIAEQKKIDDEVEPEKPSEEIEFIEGSITKSFSALGYDHVVILTSKGESVSYKVDEKSILKLDGKTVAHSSLVEGQEVKFTVEDNKDGTNARIKTLEAESKIERLDGTIYGLKELDGKSLTIEHKVNGEFERRTVDLNDNTRIFLDGKEVKFSDLREKDRIKIRVVNNVIDEIEAQAYIRKVEGVLRNIDTDLNHIDIKRADGTEIRYELDKKLEIIRANKTVSASELRVGDKVELTMADKIVTKIDASIVKSSVEGKIKSKKVTFDKTEVTILNEENRKEETYVVPNNVLVELDGRRVAADALELGYYVEIDLEGAEVIQVRGISITIKDKHLGRITYIGKNHLEVNLNNGDRVEVDITDAKLLDEAKFGISLKDLKKGDGILITGDIYGNEIIAKEILRFSK